MNRTWSTSHAFLVLPENRFAHAAITKEHADSGAGIPPVFLFGPSGVGKSHLAGLAAHHLANGKPQARIQQWTASQFAAEFAEACDNRTVSLFQSATRHLDLLILEDLHLLEGRPQTQLQLLSLTNELMASGCRIVWTSRKSPGELSSYLARLVSRFRGGVLAAMRLPGPASRRSLLEHGARAGRIAISEGALRILGNEMAVSPRELLAALERLRAQARHDRRPIDSDLVRKFLAHDLPPPTLKLDDVCRAVARQFGTTSTELKSRKRARSAALPRQCAMLLARELTTSSLEQIGRFFGGRDHSTVVHSCQRLSLLLARDPDLRSYLNQVRHVLGVSPCDEIDE